MLLGGIITNYTMLNEPLLQMERSEMAKGVGRPCDLQKMMMTAHNMHLRQTDRQADRVYHVLASGRRLALVRFFRKTQTIQLLLLLRLYCCPGLSDISRARFRALKNRKVSLQIWTAEIPIFSAKPHT